MAAIAFAIVLVVVGCPARNYTLPANWPIPQLTLPAGARLIDAPMVAVGSPSSENGQMSTAAMVLGGTAEAGIKHIESCLASLGYLERVDVFDSGDTLRDRERIYIAPDDMTVVEVLINETGSRPDLAICIRQYSTAQGALALDGKKFKWGHSEIRPLK